MMFFIQLSKILQKDNVLELQVFLQLEIISEWNILSSEPKASTTHFSNI